MNAFLKILLTGLLISWLGSLPLGTMNVVATQISVGAGMYPALFFVSGAVLVEVIYVCLAICAMDKMLARPGVFRFFEWLTVIMILALAGTCFFASRQFWGAGKILSMSPTDSFLLGILLSATSPLHVTFWFGWSTVLIDKGILVPEKRNYCAYIIGIGIGSMLGYLVFIGFGNYLINMFRGNQHLVSWIVGSVLLLTGLLQMNKIIRKYHTTAIMHDS